MSRITIDRRSNALVSTDLLVDGALLTRAEIAAEVANFPAATPGESFKAAERALIRAELPMVAVPEIPDDPAWVVPCLADAGYFEGLAVTAEDRARSVQYQGNIHREVLRAASTDQRAPSTSQPTCTNRSTPTAVAAAMASPMSRPSTPDRMSRWQ